jgi:hypothetical protein
MERVARRMRKLETGIPEIRAPDCPRCSPVCSTQRAGCAQLCSSPQGQPPWVAAEVKLTNEAAGARLRISRLYFIVPAGVTDAIISSFQEDSP